MANSQYCNIVINHDDNYFLTSDPSLMSRVEREDDTHQGVVISLSYNKGAILLSFCPGYGKPTNFRSDPCVFNPKTIVLQEGMTRFNAKAFDAYKDLFFTDRYKAMRLAALFAICDYSVEPLAVQYAKAPVPSIYDQLIKELNINPTSSGADCAQAAPAEVTTPTNEMETTINPALSVSTAEGDAASQRIATAINTALVNNADCVYNLHLEGDQTAYKAPDFGKLRDFIDTPDGEEFVSFDGAERVTMLDICNAHPSKSSPFNKMMTFSEESKKMVSEHKDAFKVGAQGVMILRVDLTGGSWYEFAINRAV